MYPIFKDKELYWYSWQKINHSTILWCSHIMLVYLTRGELASQLSLVSPEVFTPFLSLREFGFLATVSTFGFISWGHLIFGNIIDLTAQTLLDENWTEVIDDITVLSRVTLQNELNSFHNWWTLYNYRNQIESTMNWFPLNWICIIESSCLSLFLWNNLYRIKSYIKRRLDSSIERNVSPLFIVNDATIIESGQVWKRFEI